MNHQLTYLRHYIIQRFNSGELRDLCFDLAVDYENLGGEGKSDKVRELIALLCRQRRLENLIILVEKMRAESLNIDIQSIYNNEATSLLTEEPQSNRTNSLLKTFVLGSLVVLLAFISVIVFPFFLNLLKQPSETGNSLAANSITTSPTCSVQVGPLITGRDRILPGEHIPTSILVTNPENQQVTYHWRASCGVMEPSLQTNVFQSTYYAPNYVILDQITLVVQTENCEPIERTVQVWVANPDVGNPPDCTPGVQPTVVPTIIVPPAVELVIFTDYIVEENDSLELIAVKMNSSVELMQKHGIDANDLLPGTLLRLPVANPEYCPGMRSYVVRDQDTVYRIALLFNTTVDALQRINNFDEHYTLYITSVICVPL